MFSNITGKLISSRSAKRFWPLLTGFLALSATVNGQGVLGQPTTNDSTLGSRCAGQNSRFNFSNANGGMFGPSGIAVDPRGRIFVTDYGGQRVLTWPNVDTLQSCQSADGVIGAGVMAGPEAVAIDVRLEMVFVADTLSHSVLGYQYLENGWTLVATLGTPGVSGNASNQFYFPRGLAVNSDGRLFVADDYNNRILMFDPPFTDGQYASDSIGAGADGGFHGPKGLAITGNALLVADFYNNRVLRFTGPFTTPDQTYVATGSFTGLNHPVDLAVHADGSLLVTDQGNQRVLRYIDAAIADSRSVPDGGILFQGLLNPEPLGIACDRSGRVYVSDYRAFRVLIGGPSSRSPITGSSSTQAAQSLLAGLYAEPDRATARVAIGQQLTTYLYGDRLDPNAWNAAFLKLQQGNFPLPKVMGGELSDLMTYSGFYPNQDALNELIRHGKAGNIVTLVWHPDNPTQGDFSTPISTSDLQDTVNMNTATGQFFQSQLDLAAAVLRQFQDAGVPVLFRPLHEQNGNFFWWGDDGSSGADQRNREAAWVAMWRKMVTELTGHKGLHNLLFVFCANQVDYDGVTSPMAYFPGGYATDVVSMDVYNDQLNLAGDERGIQHYAALIATGKPFGLSEFGQETTGSGASSWDARTLANRVSDSYPRTAFAVAWYSAVQDGVQYVWALPDVSYTSELLSDPLIYTQLH